jgi:hypothetical protein
MRNVVFIRPTKVAGTSIEKSLNLTPAYKFSFVRNPYDRVVSAYHDMRVRGRYGRAVSRVRARTLGFEGFCKEVIDSSVDEIGTHHVYHDSIYNPQIRWVENVELNFLGRYERLYEDFAKLVEDLGLEPRELVWMRRSRNSVNRIPFMEFYCDETREIVERIYREDFERFDYPIHN